MHNLSKQISPTVNQIHHLIQMCLLLNQKYHPVHQVCGTKCMADALKHILKNYQAECV